MKTNNSDYIINEGIVVVKGFAEKKYNYLLLNSFLVKYLLISFIITNLCSLG